MTLWRPPIEEADTIPAGMVSMYLSDTPPDGWLLLNGDTIGNIGSGAIHESATLRILFDLVKNLPPNTGAEDFDAGNTVVLSDMRQRFPLCKSVAGTGNILGANGGSIDHDHSIGSHQHELPINQYGPHTHIGPIFGTGVMRTVSGQILVAPGSQTRTVLLSGPATGNTGNQNPNFLVLQFIVKV